MASSVETFVSNVGPDPMLVWLEPWCDELTLPVRATLGFHAETSAGPATPPIMEIPEGPLVIWATCPGTAEVTIAGVVQDTGSRIIPLDPAMFDMPVKSFVDLVFGDQPGTRPAGRPLRTMPNGLFRRVIKILRNRLLR